MIKDKAYFYDNVMWAVEIEYETGERMWHRSVGYNLRDMLDSIEKSSDEYLSDIDYCTHQSDEWCRKVLNLAYLNLRKNKEWCDKHNLKSLDEVVCRIIEKQLA